MERLLHVVGGTYYLTLSGSGRRLLLEEPGDADSIGSLLARAVRRSHVSIHAYCWLPRELHLAVDLLNGSLTSFLRTFAAAFARDKNRRTNYAGPLFSRGYSGILICPQTHLLPLIRYIHLLPAYLGIAKRPLDYPWSSHRAFLDSSRAASWLSPSRALSLLSPDPAKALCLYCDYTCQALSATDCSQFLDFPGRRALGPPDWFASLQQTPPPTRTCESLDQFVAAHAASFGINPNALSSRSQNRQLSRTRALIAQAAIAKGIASLSEVARAFNRSPSAMYLAIQNHTTGDRDGGMPKILKVEEPA